MTLIRNLTYRMMSRSLIDRLASPQVLSDKSRHSVINRARPQSYLSINPELTDPRGASRRRVFVGTYLEARDNEFESDSDRNARANDRVNGLILLKRYR
jgi:hypothetical protein